MLCFKCQRNMAQCKSKFGFYYFCPNCGRTFETGGQQRYNSKKYNSRADYENTKIIEISEIKTANDKDKGTSNQN